MEIQIKIQRLREELNQHNHNYYVLDHPTISDFEFEKSVNFDIPISGANMSVYTYKNLYEDINYANYFKC